jgi:peptide/nickel transport system permease protein
MATEATQGRLLLESGEFARAADVAEKIYTASQSRLVIMRLLRHRLAIVGMVVLILFYMTAILAPFLAPNDPYRYFDEYLYATPQLPRFRDDEVSSWRPFYYALERKRDPQTLKMTYQYNTAQRLYVLFFARGFPY